MLIFLIVTLFVGCGKKDHDCNKITSVKIGNQEWMAENLDVSTFRNGDAIPEEKSNAEWERAGWECRPAWCYYNNNPENGKKYGKLYNWYAVNDARGLAPDGWHIPTISELEELKAAVNSDGNTLKTIGRGTGSGAGTNTSGFSALLSGGRSDYFRSLGKFTSFWSSTESNSTRANYLFLSYGGSIIGFYYGYKLIGFSVRCVKD